MRVRETRWRGVEANGGPTFESEGRCKGGNEPTPRSKLRPKQEGKVMFLIIDYPRGGKRRLF